MSQILNCGVDKNTLAILLGLIENGVNPQALAAVMSELKRESAALKVRNQIMTTLGTKRDVTGLSIRLNP